MSIFTNPDIIREVIKLEKSKNFMKDVVFHGCARPWYIYVETFFPAFLKLFITLILFDIDDIARAYGQNMARTRATGKRKHVMRQGRQVLRVVQTEPQRITKVGLRIVLRLTAPLEAAGFTFLMVAAGDKFFGDWQSLIERSPFCESPIGTGPISRGDPPSALSIEPFGQAFGYDTLEQNRGGWPTTAFNFEPATGPLFVVATLKGVAGLGGISNAALRIRITIAGDDFNFDSDFLSAEAGEPVEFVAIARRFLLVGTIAVVRWEMVGDTQLAAVRPTEGNVMGMIELGQFSL